MVVDGFAGTGAVKSNWDAGRLRGTGWTAGLTGSDGLVGGWAVGDLLEVGAGLSVGVGVRDPTAGKEGEARSSIERLLGAS